MREIKFRAWNEVKNRIFTDVQCGVDLGIQICFGDVLAMEEFKVMQFTGLKDKNGVDIYEGDIYKGEDNKHYEIIFINGAFCGGYKAFTPMGWMSNGQEFGDDCIEDDFSNKIEVIGNIYQNPELLNP